MLVQLYPLDVLSFEPKVTGKILNAEFSEFEDSKRQLQTLETVNYWVKNDFPQISFYYMLVQLYPLVVSSFDPKVTGKKLNAELS